MYVVALCDNFEEEIEIKPCPKAKITLTSDFDNDKRVQNYFESTDANATVSMFR